MIGERSSALAAELLLALGFDAKAPLSISGTPVLKGTGLVIQAPDPDGDGRLVLMKGEDADGLHQTLTTPVDLLGRGWSIVRSREVQGRGPWPPVVAPRFAFERPLALRCDRELERLQREFGALGRDEIALLLARAFEGQRPYFAAALAPGVDLFAFHRRLLAGDAASLARFRDADLAALVVAIEARAKERFGERAGQAPAVAFLVGDPTSTNARTFGAAPVTGRLGILINVAAHTDLQGPSLSVAYELVPTRQLLDGESLAAAAVREGVAAFLAGQLVPEEDPARLLMWPTDKLAAASARVPEILAAFRVVADEPASACGDWLLLDRPLGAVPGAPDRCAYWVGYLAAVRWADGRKPHTYAQLD